MAELVVSSIIDQLTDVAVKQIGERVCLVTGVEEAVENLTSKLTTIKGRLQDAERTRVKEKLVDRWLGRLKDITYEMEDVLGDWNNKIDKPRNLDQGMPTLLKKVRSLISSLCSCLKEVPVRWKIALKIKKINGKLECLLGEPKQFNFFNIHSDYVEDMSISIIDESEVYGRDDDKKILLEHLLPNSTASTSKEVGKDGVKVVSIVGAGGIGKTTLAQMIYNNDRVREHFEPRAWVFAPDPFDMEKIAKALLERLGKNVNASELETLFQDIQATLSGKRFLIVFDNVCTDKLKEWKPFGGALKNGASGSIILVTTEKDTVARVVGTKYTHSLKPMSDSECWSILKQIALSQRPELCESVQQIGYKIAEKCEGLPSAAYTLGSLLLQKDTEEEWNEVLKVLNSKLWQSRKASIDHFHDFYLKYKEPSVKPTAVD